MIFKINDLTDLKKFNVAQIIEHTSLKDFLSMKSNMKSILLCPTNAIDIESGNISNKCIDCGVCWVKNKDKVIKISDNPDYESFKSYIDKEKMYVYRWLSQISANYSGINITSTGFSRIKRIPLIIKKEKILYLFKSIRNIADIKEAEYELNDIMDLIQEDVKDYEVICVIIIINEFQESGLSKNRKILKLKDIYNKMLETGKIDINDIIK